MANSKHTRAGQWHLRRVIIPKRLTLSNGASRWFFLHELEARWSRGSRRWYWRVPGKHQAR